MQYAIGGVKPSKGIPGLSIERHTWNPNALIIIKMEQVKKEILKTLCSHAKNTKEAYDAFMASYPKEDTSEVKRVIRHEFYEIQKTERKNLTNLEEREIKLNRTFWSRSSKRPHGRYGLHRTRLRFRQIV